MKAGGGLEIVGQAASVRHCFCLCAVKKESCDSQSCCVSADLLRDSGSFLLRSARDGELRRALQHPAKNTPTLDLSFNYNTNRAGFS